MEFEKWESAIGRLVLSCSIVEFELLRLYEKYLSKRSFYDDSYLNRFDNSIGVVKREFLIGDEIAENLIEMRKMAEYRHLVAHNPVLYDKERECCYIQDQKNGNATIDLSEIIARADYFMILSGEIRFFLQTHVES